MACWREPHHEPAGVYQRATLAARNCERTKAGELGAHTATEPNDGQLERREQ